MSELAIKMISTNAGFRFHKGEQRRRLG